MYIQIKMNKEMSVQSLVDKIKKDKMIHDTLCMTYETEII